MRLKEYFDYSKYAEVLHLNKFELAFCVGYFVLALGICLYSTPGGSLFSPDSTTYVLQAEGIYKNHNFPSSGFVPMYPMLIAIIMGLGLTSEQSAAIIPIIFYSLLGFPLFLIGKIICRPIIGYISCITCLLCGKYLLNVSTYAWTEMPYIFFSVVAILFMAIFNRYGYRSSINIAGIFIIFASLTRYVGVALIPVGLLLIAVNIRDFKKALTTILNFCLITIIPFGIFKFVISPNTYVMTTTKTIRSFSTTIHQFRINLEQLFYNDYGLVAIIVMLFFVIAIIAIYLNKRLTAFTKDTIPLTGYITIYCIMMILMNTSWGNYTLTNALHLRYIIPIFPFVMLFIFSSFSDRYNSKSMYNTAYKALPVILCILLVAQGASALYSQASDIRATSITFYSDLDKISKFISENNISAQDRIYLDTDADYALFIKAFLWHNPRIPYAAVIQTNLTDSNFPDNLTVRWGRSMSARSIVDLIKDNKNLPIYITASSKASSYYIEHPPKDICLTNPGRISKYTIFRAELKQNGSCNQDAYPKSYLVSNRSVLSTPIVGDFMTIKRDQLLLLTPISSDTQKEEYNLKILDFSRGPLAAIRYEGSGLTEPLAYLLNTNSTPLTGDFVGLGYSQILSIDRNPIRNRIFIQDFSQGEPPAITRYLEVIGDNSTLVDSGDAMLAGDFLGLGRSQVLFVDRKTRGGKLVIADFSKGKTPEMTEFSEIEGNSTQLGLMLDAGDKQLSGDFMGLGHSLLLMINCNHTGAKEPKIIIADFSKGIKSASIRYQENWNESTYLSGWLDADDTQLVGDFMGLGHSQVLFVNHGHAGGKITIADFSQGKPPANNRYWESWDKGTIFQGWLGINDTKISGDFKGLGYSQVLFLNNSIKGSNATIVEFINGMPEIAL